MEAEVNHPRAQWFSDGESGMAEEEQGSRRGCTKLARDSASQSRESLDKAADGLPSGILFASPFRGLVERATAEHLQPYSLV